MKQPHLEDLEWYRRWVESDRHPAPCLDTKNKETKSPRHVPHCGINVRMFVQMWLITSRKLGYVSIREVCLFKCDLLPQESWDVSIRQATAVLLCLGCGSYDTEAWKKLFFTEARFAWIRDHCNIVRHHLKRSSQIQSPIMSCQIKIYVPKWYQIWYALSHQGSHICIFSFQVSVKGQGELDQRHRCDCPTLVRPDRRQSGTQAVHLVLTSPPVTWLSSPASISLRPPLSCHFFLSFFFTCRRTKWQQDKGAPWQIQTFYPMNSQTGNLRALCSLCPLSLMVRC